MLLKRRNQPAQPKPWVCLLWQAAHPTAPAPLGLLGPELATPCPPWEGIPHPTGLWCNQQGSACPCPGKVEHEVATVTPVFHTGVQEVLSVTIGLSSQGD